jgi:pimeloyl-ACP methyl ester carboxylesterase
MSESQKSPLLVLVHGGAFTSRWWDPMIPLLTTPAVVVDLPGRRYRPADLSTVRRSDWERAVAADVIEAAHEHGVVLVGHSSGGYVIPGAAALLPPGTVLGLVFVCATCPAEGRRPVDSMTPKLEAITLANKDAMWQRSAGVTIGDTRPGEPPIVTDLAVVEVSATMGIEAPAQLFEAMTWVGVPDVARLYIRALRDRVIPPDHAVTMAANANADEIIDIDATHDVMASAPVELAAMLCSFATSVMAG